MQLTNWTDGLWCKHHRVMGARLWSTSSPAVIYRKVIVNKGLDNARIKETAQVMGMVLDLRYQ